MATRLERWTENGVTIVDDVYRPHWSDIPLVIGWVAYITSPFWIAAIWY